MACSSCGLSNCLGFCVGHQRSVYVSGGNAVGQFPNYPIIGPTGFPVGQFQGNGQLSYGTSSYPKPSDHSLSNFLDIIADKTDTEACMAFVDQQLKMREFQQAELEKIRQGYQENLDRLERDFLEKCLKYRPSISPEALERVKKLKAFF